MKTNNLYRGINLGNILEALDEGRWRYFFDEKFLKVSKEKGFDFVRIPIRWSAHLFDGVIDEKFVERVRDIITLSLSYGFPVIINTHHYDALDNEPEAEEHNLYKIWEQLSIAYKDFPDSLIFEINNEPKNNLTTEKWVVMQDKCIEIIRKTNKTRKIVITGADWGGPYELLKLENKYNDPNLIGSFHYYFPIEFTHQGDDWGIGLDPNRVVEWTGTENEKSAIEKDFILIKEWSEKTGIPVLLGEFGTTDKADMPSRVNWTSYVCRLSEKYGFAWCYWKLLGSFGIYNPTDEVFNDELVGALINEQYMVDTNTEH